MSSGTTITRRGAMQAGLLAAAGTLIAPPRLVQATEDAPLECGRYGGRVLIEYDERQSWNELYGNPPMLGRVEASRLRITPGPEDYENVTRWVTYGSVLPIYGAIRHEGRWGYAHNDVWFDVGEGVIHSSWVVPCREMFHRPEGVPRDGFWGEVTVPTSWQHWEPDLCSNRYYDLAYGSVHRVTDAATDAYGRTWYGLADDSDPDAIWWVQAEHIRRIAPEEFSPISPDISPDRKHIYVDLTAQELVCTEDDRTVFATRIATGTTWYDLDNKPHDFHTPTGTFPVLMKRASRHMVGGESINDRYDLPGVPWCTFITWSGVAIHGTYWHNDYGHKRSHGCINVTNDAAKWIFRWTLPEVPADEVYFFTSEDHKESATNVTIYYS